MKNHQKALSHFKKVDSKLHSEILRVSPLKFSKRKRSRFETLVESIISQQLSVKASDTIFKRFVALFPLGRFPTAEQILEIEDARLRQAGLSFQKISYLKDLSAKVLSKELKLRNLHRLSDEKVIVELVKVKGIGRWTAEMFLMFNLEREDVFSFGDLGLQNAIKKIYRLKSKPTQKQMEKIVKLWAPYKTIASRYLWKSLDNEPLN